MEKRKDLVSVIIPVYNVERFLARCLESVLTQDYGELEVICVNDGSTDSSGDILRDFAARDQRIKVITQENRGLSGARNSGLEVFTGDWVMFVDSDDYLPSYAVSAFLDAVRRTGCPLAASERYVVDALPPGDRAPLPSEVRRFGKPLRNLIGKRKMQSSAWNKFYSADLVRNRRFIEGIYFEDWPFITEVFGVAESFALIRHPLYVYCLNGGAPSILRSSFTQKKADSYITGIKHVRALFPEGGWRRRYARKRADIALGMLRKRAKRAGIALPPEYAKSSLWRRIISFLAGRTR